MEPSRSPRLASRENRDYQRATAPVYRASFSTGGYRRLTPRFLPVSQQQLSASSEELQADKSEIIKEYDRLVDGPAARKRLEKERPSLVAARDQAIVELRLEKLQNDRRRAPRKVARVRR